MARFNFYGNDPAGYMRRQALTWACLSLKNLGCTLERATDADVEAAKVKTDAAWWVTFPGGHTLMARDWRDLCAMVQEVIAGEHGRKEAGAL